MHITPRLPKALEFAAVSHVSWRGPKLRLRITPSTVDILGTAADGSPVSLQLDIKLGGTAVLEAQEILNADKPVK